MSTTTSESNRSPARSVSGVDLRYLDDDVVTEIRRAWLEHKVLFFRDQELTQAQHVAYGRALGELEVHPFTENDESHPEIIVLESSPEEFVAAENWHSDVTFRECPPLGSILYGQVLPPYGGDTCWANMELAYDLLPDDVKEEIDGLYAIDSYAKAFTGDNSGTAISDDEFERVSRDFPPQKHPIVRTHPETGRKSLFINRPFVIGIDGMAADESRPLRNRLYRQTDRIEITCRFRWWPGSIAQWDNRCTQHYAVPDYGGHHRRMERVTLIGDRPA